MVLDPGVDVGDDQLALAVQTVTVGSGLFKRRPQAVVLLAAVNMLLLGLIHLPDKSVALQFWRGRKKMDKTIDNPQ